MRFRLPLRIASAVATALVLAPPAGGDSLDACAQRVIRDWYSDGRVDDVHPLACYRAAIRALPEDVRQYSDAGRDIARALAYARRGRRDPGDAPPRSAVAAEPPTATMSHAPRASRSTPPASRDATASPPPAPTRPIDGSARLASAPRVDTAAAGLPYPLLGLATLALLLFATAAAAAVRRRAR